MRQRRPRRPWLLALAAIALADPGLSVADSAPTFAELRERGRRAYQAERFNDARQVWSAAAALKPDDAETAADLALTLQHLRMTDQAIQANRDAIRLAASPRYSSARARRIRRAAYYNLGKLEAGRKMLFDEDNDGPSSCVSLVSDGGCPRPVFACGRTGADGSRDGRVDYKTARFALDRETAQIVEDKQLIAAFESWVDFGYEADKTRDRSDAPQYDVTLQLSSETREPIPGEADGTVAMENSGCVVVHVDACGGRLGLFCAWDAWERGITAKPHAKAVELTFARGH